ncbi:MAG: tetratricopeptide repeat protein [Burkholderiales bacterium]
MSTLNNNANQLLEAADFNFARGRYDAAFDQYFEAFTQEFCEVAQKRLTNMTVEGLLSPEQLEKLFTYHNSLDSQRGGISSFNVGLMYENGVGKLKPDLGIAVRYYEKAVEEQIPDAYANLAQILVTGSGEPWGVKKDIARGIELLEKGVEAGSVECAYTLGCIYVDGKGVPANQRKAAYFLAVAYLAKHEHAHRLLILLQETSKLDFSAEVGAAKKQVDEWELLKLTNHGASGR